MKIHVVLPLAVVVASARDVQATIPSVQVFPPEEKPAVHHRWVAPVHIHKPPQKSDKEVWNRIEYLLGPISTLGLTSTEREAGRTRLHSIPGKHHDFNVMRSEDSGFNTTIDLALDGKPRISVDVLAVFDGHGAPSADGYFSAGRNVSSAAAQIFHQKLLDNLPSFFDAPVKQTQDQTGIPWVSSRQGVLSNLLRTVEEEVKQRLKADETSRGGATATTVLAIRLLEEKKSPVLLLCSNLGDSRAVAFSFTRQSGSWTVEGITQLSVEDNVRELEARKEVRQVLLSNGYAALETPEQFAVATSLYVPVNFAERLQSIQRLQGSPWSIYQLQGIGKKINGWEKQMQSTFRAFQVRDPYLLMWDTPTGKRGNSPPGIQLTSTLGDTLFHPAKRNYQSPEAATVAILRPNTQALTVVVAASDGLWDHAKGGTMLHQNRMIAEQLRQELNSIDQISTCYSGDLAQFMSVRLAKVALLGGLHDDLTMVISVYRNSELHAPKDDLKRW